MDLVGYRNYINNTLFSQKDETYFQQAIEQGNTASLSEIVDNHPAFISTPLPNGELPLNYAIRVANQASIQLLLEKGADPLIFDDQHLNALTTAYFKQDYAAVDRLLEHVVEHNNEWKAYKGIDVSRDDKGLNAFHYAAALHGKETIKLARIGLQHQQPQEELAKILDGRSPFAISKYDTAMFACSVALRLFNHFPALGASPRILQALQLANSSSLLLNNDLKSFAILAASYSHIFIEELAPLSMGINALLTMNLAYNTFQGLRSCWRNASLNPKQAAIKAAVVHGPKAISSFEIVGNLKEYFKVISNLNAQIKAYTEREMTCLKNTQEGFPLQDCKEKSFKILRSCVANPESTNCVEDKTAFKDFLFFKNPVSYDVCKDIYPEPESKLECQQKAANWKENCLPNEIDTQSEGCTRAYNVFKSAQNRDFAPDYNEDFWRLVRYEKLSSHDCQQYKRDYSEECTRMAQIVEIDCSDPLSQRCEKILNNFEERMSAGFKPDYNSEYWLKKDVNAIYSHLCVDEGKEDCYQKLVNVESKCVLNLNSPECKKAREIFKEGLEKGFVPNVPKNFFYTIIDQCQDAASPIIKAARPVWDPISDEIAYRLRVARNGLNFLGGSVKFAFKVFRDTFFSFQYGHGTRNPFDPFAAKQKCSDAYQTVTGKSDEPTLKELKKAFRAKALQYHPDKNPGDAKAAEQYSKIDEAYRTGEDCLKNK